MTFFGSIPSFIAASSTFSLVLDSISRNMGIPHFPSNSEYSSKSKRTLLSVFSKFSRRKLIRLFTLGSHAGVIHTASRVSTTDWKLFASNHVSWYDFTHSVPSIFLLCSTTTFSHSCLTLSFSQFVFNNHCAFKIPSKICFPQSSLTFWETLSKSISRIFPSTSGIFCDHIVEKMRK